MIKRFYLFELKKSIWPTIILTLCSIVLYIPALINAIFTPSFSDIKISSLSTFLCIACMIVPILEFSYLKKKRSIDQYYSLPIKRSSIIIIKFISGFIKIFISYSIAFFLGLLVLLFKENNLFIEHYFPYYIFSILLGLSLYGFSSFIYSRGNTILDGIIFIIFYIFVFEITISFIVKIFNINYFTWGIFISYSPISLLTNFYEGLIKYGSYRNISNPQVIDLDWISYLLWSIVGLLSIIGLIFSSKFDKAERAEQLSDSFFGYRVLIPSYLIMFTNLTGLKIRNDFIDIVFLAFIYVFCLVFYIIYRRTFKLPLKYWIILSCAFVIAII